MKYQNRWNVRLGKYKPVITKRISKDLEFFRKDAKNLLQAIFERDLIAITTYFRKQYGLGLAEAANLMVYFLGVYNNEGPLFTTTRYEKGKLVAERIKSSVPN
jgi:hypothetical protein